MVIKKTAYQIQKERIIELEDKANKLLAKCKILTLASINDKGYPRICAISKILSNGLREIYFITSKRSKINGKAVHFEKDKKASVCYYLGGDSVTLIGNVDIITNKDEKLEFDKYCDRKFFRKGIEDPKCYLLKFTTVEATFWIEGKFKTCKFNSQLKK